MFAGHGVADSSYRPPRLPYASVVGPLNLEIESDRDPPRTQVLRVLAPGYLAGRSLAAEAAVPQPGTLSLRLDGDAILDLDVDFGTLTDVPLDDDRVGRQTATALANSIRDAVDGGQAILDGAPPPDDRAAELRAVTVRWDRALRRFVMTSGRRGVTAAGDGPAPTSTVEIREPTQLATALGFDDDALVAEGRLVRHRAPNPRAIAVDVRLDLWAGSQIDLADIVEAWARITPTRGQLLLAPALLTVDAADGDNTLGLQPQGESPTRWTLLQLEPGNGYSDRLTGQPPELSGEVSVTTDELVFTGDGLATLRFFEPSPVAVAWALEHPGANGYAVATGLRVDAAAAADGDVVTILVIEHLDLDALRIAVEFSSAGNGLTPQLVVDADRSDGEPFPTLRAPLDPAALTAGVELHVVVDARLRRTTAFVDGQPVETPSDPGAAATAAGGPGMDLILGDPDSAPVEFAIRHLAVHGRPLGPADPKLRLTTSPARAWAVGDPIAIARSDDGVTVTGPAFAATVAAVDDDGVTLDRPVVGDWPRAGSLVYKRGLFFAQRQLRRSDDLMNRLYRLSAEYRVSAFLDERYPSVSAPLVETTEVDLRDLARLEAELASPDDPRYPLRPAPTAPGATSDLVPSHLPTTPPTGGEHG